MTVSHCLVKSYLLEIASYPLVTILSSLNFRWTNVSQNQSYISQPSLKQGIVM